MLAALDLQKGGKRMDIPKENVPKNRLMKKLRSIIKREYAKLSLQGKNFSELEIFDSIFKSIEETQVLLKLQAMNVEIEVAKTEAFNSVFGKEQCQQWKISFLAELEEKFEKSAEKLQRKGSKKKRDGFYQKIMVQQEKLMNYCLLMGAEWEEIQDILDETINDVL